MKHSGITRRRMLVNSARALAGLTMVSSCRPFDEARKETPRGFKLAVCDWTIGKTADPGSLEAAKRIGLDGVQVDFGRGEDTLPLFDADLQRRFLDEVLRQDMEIASMAMGVLNNIPYKSDPRAERWVADGIDVCKALGVNVVLLAFFGNGDLRDDEEGKDVVVERLKRVAAKAEKAGVFLAIESWLSAEEHLEIIDRVGSPAVKVYYDVANSNMAGYDIYKEIRLLGKNICEFHAKDYDDLYGKGSIDFERVREAMDDIGYRGWLVIEGTKMPLGVEESCRYDAEYLRGIFPPEV
ncbi:MAG TPA: sugar phosphate isomerase/epimerase family protein [Sedimentisphaerales bacterium]|nr:sugar phosphate isomerase/epimerase family protein [Sedimentisphaerales bacterium]